MNYDAAVKFLKAATSTDGAEPEINRPAYFAERDVTVATDKFRIHIVKGKYAGEPDDNFPPIFDAMERYNPTNGVTFTWHVAGADLEAVRDFLRWAGKAKTKDIYGKHVILDIEAGGGAVIETDDEAEWNFSIQLPGKFFGDGRGEIAVNPKYLADALLALQKGNATNMLRLRLPSVDKPELKALVIEYLYPEAGVEAHVLPVRSKRFDRRRAEVEKAAVA